MKFISTFVKKSQGRIIGISPQKYYENQIIESGYLFNLQDNSLINHMKISKDNINKIKYIRYIQSKKVILFIHPN